MKVQAVAKASGEPTATDLAWAAGFWDGEGCVYVDRRAQIPSLQVSQSGDEAVALLLRFCTALGVAGTIYEGYRKHDSHKLAFKLHIRDVVTAVDRCWPYLSETKRAQARDALDRHAARKANYVHHSTKKTHCPNDHEYTEENTLISGGKRRCRACRRESYYRKSTGVVRRRSKYKVNAEVEATRVEVRQDEMIEASIRD